MNYLTFLLASMLQLQQPGVLQHYDSIPSYPQNEFRSPVNIPLLLSGNFGEPRKAHFHTGLDIRTNEKEGFPIFAIGDGYVSRINVSSVGYGNALYITHPNGFTSVYAHLQSFSEPITDMLRKEQYDRKEFSVDILLKPDVMPIKKGEVVALSGNSGGSAGPHLHFEIRDSLERPINPFHFGFRVNDQIAPSIGWIKFYAQDNLKFSSDGYRLLSLSNGRNSYKLNTPLVKLNASEIGIGVNTFDRMNNTINSYGVYEIKLLDNDKLIYHYRMDRISFDHKRCIISQCDYPVFLKESSRNLHRCFVEPNNPLPAYPVLENRGILSLSDHEVHHIKIICADFDGNESTVLFDVIQDMTALAFKATKPKAELILDYTKETDYSSAEGFKAEVPAHCLFDSLWVNYSAKSNLLPNTFSSTFNFGNATDHLNDYYNVSLKMNKEVMDPEKAVIVWKDERGHEAAKGGTWENGFIKTKVRELGSFYIKMDTVLPLLQPISSTTSKLFKKGEKILFRTADALSGISDYNAYIDGQWQLMEFDAKYGLLKVLLDNHVSSGIHMLRIEVSDERKNKKQWQGAIQVQ